MTLHLELDLIYNFLKELNPNVEGWVRLQSLLEKISLHYTCSQLAARNFVTRHPEFFEFKHGFIRFKMTQTLDQQALDVTDYEAWLKERVAILEECLEFLKVQTPSPYIENLLVYAGSVRDELRAYDDTKLLAFVMKLKQEYNYTPTKNLLEGET